MILVLLRTNKKLILHIYCILCILLLTQQHQPQEKKPFKVIQFFARKSNLKLIFFLQNIPESKFIFVETWAERENNRFKSCLRLVSFNVFILSLAKTSIVHKNTERDRKVWIPKNVTTFIRNKVLLLTAAIFQSDLDSFFLFFHMSQQTSGRDEPNIIILLR